jgi:hypothetical protein
VKQSTVELSLCLTWHHTIKEVELHAFLTSALDEGEWSASRPGKKKIPDTQWVGGWWGPKNRSGRGGE